jgi:hypothetical protein
MKAWFEERLERLRSQAWWSDALERTLWTMGQGMFAVLVVVTSLPEPPPWQVTLAYVAGGAITSLVLALLALPEPESRSWLVATLWRLARTALAALVGLIAAALTVDGFFDPFAFDWGNAFSVIGVTLGTAFLKALWSKVPELRPATPEQLERASRVFDV